MKFNVAIGFKSGEHGTKEVNALAFFQYGIGADINRFAVHPCPHEEGVTILSEYNTGHRVATLPETDGDLITRALIALDEILARTPAEKVNARIKEAHSSLPILNE
jgi:hypothetical protein